MIDDLIFWFGVPAIAAIFWLLPQRHRYRFLALASFGMVGAHDLFSALSLAVYAVCLFLSLPRIAVGDNRAGLLLAAWIVVLAGFILIFKAEPVFDVLAGRTNGIADVIVPLGSSYYIFKMIHVAVDAYRRREYDTSADTFFSYLFLFTAFAAGPIQRLDLFRSGQSASLDAEAVYTGLSRIAFGIIKVILISSAVAASREHLTTISTVSLETLASAPVFHIWIVLVSTYLIAYLNLGGYTDIAIGASRMFGIRIQENFNWPIAACSLPDFWRRWHITLSTWCRDYVYITALGWLRNPYLPLFFSFQVMGLWHVVGWNRVSWGLWQALGVFFAMLWARAMRPHNTNFEDMFWLRNGFGWVLTQLFITLSWVFVIGETGADPMAPLRIIARALGVGAYVLMN